jgi:cysteinyl-tRNA synthetase
VSLRLYDTATRAVRVFEPVVPGRASIYLCGPTVQAAPHVGHIRSAVVVDVLRRWLAASGYDVVFARNVTDVDDKIIDAAAQAGEPWWALAERQARAFTAAYDAVGVLPPTVEPRATGHVPQMVELIGRLVDAGAAYPAGGDVYFAVRRFPRYGELSGQRLDAMRVTEDAAGKRDPLDFALWKAAKPGEPAWETPWGPGRPGWHLECSAMATAYLGETFDIHGGGLDLVFPHHENERAQSEAAGDGFARYWVHHGLLDVGEQKMSKSLGNSLVVADVLTRVRAPALRYYLAAPHYRSALMWAEDGLAEAETAYARCETFVRNAVEALGEAEGAAGTAAFPSGAASFPDGAASGSVGTAAGDELGLPAWREFAAAMDDDLATPRALATVHGAIRDGNAALATGDRAALADWLHVVRRMLATLGLDPITDWPQIGGSDRTRTALDALVGVVVGSRQAARERRDFADADRLRDALAAAGVVVEDTPDGPRWRMP